MSEQDVKYKCVLCGKPVPQIANKKHRLYCNDKCRKAYKRSISGQSKADKSNTDTPEIKSGQANTDNLEQCQYCGVDLPKLQQPRRYVGACYTCSLKQVTKRSETCDPHFTGKLTDYEAEHYKPASELHAHEFNPVSKPGRCRACGEVIDSECLTHCKNCIVGGALEKGLTPISSEDCK